MSTESVIKELKESMVDQVELILSGKGEFYSNTEDVSSITGIENLVYYVYNFLRNIRHNSLRNQDKETYRNGFVVSRVNRDDMTAIWTLRGAKDDSTTIILQGDFAHKEDFVTGSIIFKCDAYFKNVNNDHKCDLVFTSVNAVNIPMQVYKISIDTIESTIDGMRVV